MIIIEGPDNAGKTTLCEKLSKRLNVPIEHSGGPGKSKQEMQHRINEMFVRRNYACIRDRIPIISDYIYSKSMGRESLFDDNNISQYLSDLLCKHPVIIFCWPGERHLFESSHEMSKHADEEHHINVEAKKVTIANMYQSVMRRIPHYTYDFNKDDVTFLQQVCEHQLGVMRNDR